MTEITVRMARPEDAPDLLSIYAPYVRDTSVTFEYEVPDVEEFRARILRTLTRYPYLAACQDGRIIGYAYVSPFKERAAYSWAVETSIYVDRDCHGAGAGSALHRALEEILRRQHILNMNACIVFPNPESISFHEKQGYHKVAHFSRCGYKQGKWWDMIWMEKFLGEHPARPLPVIPITQL